jgi:hypothetical protein
LDSRSQRNPSIVKGIPKLGIKLAIMIGEMKSKKYSMFHLPLLSFFSKRLYWDVGCNWKGANLSYLFLLLAICWIPPTLSMRKDLIQSLDNKQLQIINQLPEIHIKNGRVEVEQEQPYYIKHNGKNKVIIDTTGSMNYITDANVWALLTENKLIFRRGANHFNTLDLSGVSSFHFNKHIANQLLQTTKNSLAPLSYGIFLLLSYIFTVLVMLLVAVVGLILATANHTALKFAGTLRIATAAVTPSIILIMASIVLGKSIPALAYIAITLLYLCIGIKSCTDKTVEEKVIPKLNLSALLDEEDSSADRHTHAA